MEKPLRDEAMIAPYRELLRISKPWEIRTVRFDVMKRQLEFDVGLTESAALICPECGRMCPSHDRPPEPKSWRLSSMKAHVIIRASVPCCHCPKHGIQPMRPSFEPGASYVEHRDVSGRNPLARIGPALRPILMGERSQHLYLIVARIFRPIADTIREPFIARTLSEIRPAASAVTLPLDTDPPYKTYHSLGAHPLSILGATGDLRPLLASDYINFSCLKTPNQGSFGAVIVPWRSIGKFVALGYCELRNTKEKLSFKMKDSARLIQWLVDRIHDKWYLIAHVNKYYVPGSWAHLRQVFLHDCLIFGCDTEKRIFQIAIYLATGTYGVASVPFTCMAMALTLRGSKYYDIFSICHAPAVLAVRPKAGSQIRFDQDAAFKNLDAYLHSMPPDEGILACDDLVYAGDWAQASGYPTASHVYGLCAFAAIVSHIRLFVERGSVIDLHDTRALWEHKKIMHSNISYWGAQTRMSDGRKLTQHYEEVVDWARTLHVMCVACHLDDLKNRRQEVIAHLDKSGDMIEIEKAILGQCYLKIRMSVRGQRDSLSLL